jgi:tetratricopeptide (TPR) repeat protein
MKPTNEQEEFELIEAYLMGNLNQETLTLFEDRLKNETEFTEKVEKVKKSYDLVMQAALETSIVNTISELQRNRRKNTKNYPVILKKLIAWSAAASIVFISYLSLTSIDFPDTEYDFNVMRGVDSTQMNDEQRVAFNSFFEGQAHLVEGRYVLATKDFEKSLGVDSIRPYFKEAAEWHLALAYVKSNQPAKAQKIYERLSDCIDCEYPVSRIDKWKLWWQIQWTKIL